MGHDQKRQAERNAARVLWGMLLRPPYLHVWRDFALSNDLVVEPGKVNQEAIRRLVCIYAHGEGHPDFRCPDGKIDCRDEDPETPEQLKKRPWKDRINRVATARQLSGTTLNAFIGALGIIGNDQIRLQAVHSGEDRKVVIGELPPPRQSGFPASKHDTLIIFDEHYVGADGLPESHETTQVVVSRVEKLEYVPVRFDIETLADFAYLELVRGGAMRDEPIKLPNGKFEYRFEFPRPLALYETAQLKYRIKFAYRRPPPCEYRRAVFGHFERLSIYVKFHSACRPEHVYWSQWTSLEVDSPMPDREEPVDLDNDLSVHRDLSYIENALVGFRWSGKAHPGV